MDGLGTELEFRAVIRLQPDGNGYVRGMERWESRESLPNLFEHFLQEERQAARELEKERTWKVRLS